MARREIDTIWDRTTRNNINENFIELYDAPNTANEAKDIASKAKTIAENAEETANESLQQSESTQQQLDSIILESGTSDAEVVQARTNERGKQFDILKDRLDNLDVEFEQRGVNVKWFGASGSDQSTTGSIASGSNELTVANAIDFEVGQGILIEGAGPGGVAEVAELQITSSPTNDGQVVITLDGIATNVTVDNGEFETASLEVTAAPTVAGNIIVTLDGLSTNIAVDPAIETTAEAVADKIRSNSFTGWTTGGASGTTTVTFTANTVGDKTDAVYDDNGTGATGTMTTTTQGYDADTAIEIADNIRNTSFAGWTTGGTAGTDTVTFTSDTVGTKQNATFNANGTGVSGVMTTTTEGQDGGNLVTSITAINGTVFTLSDSANADVANANVEHDDQEAIQAALDYAESLNGGIVNIPVGTYFFDFIYIPNNVRLIGNGFDTILKLRKNSNSVKERIPTGIYPKYNIDFFSVENLAYDGNAEESVDIHTITLENFNTLYYAHGISNGYADENTNTDDPSQTDNNRWTRNFLIKNVHIKNTIRNCILISGRGYAKGEVNNVILENSYADHHIYESHTNTIVSYKSVTLKGFYRGVPLTIECGQFDGLTFQDYVTNPAENLTQSGLIDFRDSYQEGLKTKPSIANVNISVPFGELYFMFSAQSPNKVGKGFFMRDVVINQTDVASVGTNNLPLSLLSTNGIKEVVIENVELHNIVQMNLLGTSYPAKDISIKNVKYFYSDSRSSSDFEDTLLLVSSEGGRLSGITIEDIHIMNKAPSLLKFRQTKDTSSNITDVNFSNIILERSGNTKRLFEITNDTYFDLRRFNVTNSRFSGFANIDIYELQNKGIFFNNVNYNGGFNSKLGEKGVINLEGDWDGSIDYFKNEMGQVTLRGISVSAGTTSGQPKIATLPNSISPSAGVIFPLSVYNHTQGTILPANFIITGSTTSIQLFSASGINSGDNLRFNTSYQK